MHANLLHSDLDITHPRVNHSLKVPSYSTPTLHVLGRTDVIVIEERTKVILLDLSQNKRVEGSASESNLAYYISADHVLYDFGGLVDFQEEGLAIATALGSKKAAILQNHGLLVASGSIESAVYFFMSFERCCQVQMIADQAAASRGQRPHAIDPARAALTHEPLGSEIVGWFNGTPEFQLLEHNEGNRFEYTPADKEKL
ncbi:hypothetical protein DFH29DRAFT_1079378 [Suillus ampliporus]|nr:hypothetical protein DFH29DRAFT_1079378 [Suillus ampliporus]